MTSSLSIRDLEMLVCGTFAMVIRRYVNKGEENVDV